MGGCHTVLLASKDPVLITVMETALVDTHGYRLIVAGDERQATQLLADLDIDLLIADLQDMPDAVDFVMTSRTVYPGTPRILLAEAGEAEQGVTVAHGGGRLSILGQARVPRPNAPCSQTSAGTRRAVAPPPAVVARTQDFHG